MTRKHPAFQPIVRIEDIAPNRVRLHLLCGHRVDRRMRADACRANAVCPICDEPAAPTKPAKRLDLTPRPSNGRRAYREPPATTVSMTAPQMRRRAVALDGREVVLPIRLHDVAAHLILRSPHGATTEELGDLIWAGSMDQPETWRHIIYAYIWELRNIGVPIVRGWPDGYRILGGS